ncbi:MAG: hypothetical protein IT330_08580 [Anaerolineae bacterium]|nr:hypothetical protein [Anaerolineae bacterium]
MTIFQRIRPTRTTLATLVGLLWALSFGAARDFVWADLRTGMVDLRGLPRVTRVLVWLGFLLRFAMVGALIFNDLWRAEFELLPLYAGTPGRGELIPLALVPATLFLLTMAWTFALAGALHSHWLLRLVVLGLYMFVATTWTGISAQGRSGLLGPLLVWGLLVAVPFFFVLRWRRRARPIAEFVFLLLVVAATFALAQAQAVTLWRISGVPLVLGSLNTNVLAFSGLAMPFLLLIGMDIAGFVQQAAGWVTGIIATRLTRWAVYPVLLALLGWRLRDVVSETLTLIQESSLRAVAASYMGALGVPLLVGLAWWFVSRWRKGAAATPLTTEGITEAGEKNAPWLILAFQGYQVVSLVLLVLFGAVGAIAIIFLEDLPLAQVQKVATQLVVGQLYWPIVIKVVALAVAFWFLRREWRAPALYLGTFAAMQLWFELAAPGRPLANIAWRGAGPVDFWWVVILALIGLFWLLRRELTAARAGRLLLIVLMTALLRQTDFISDPFSPFFGFAGIGLVAFGIVWDALTIGSWANASSPALPRVSRIFLYLGYVLFTVTIVNWVLTTHNLSYVETFGGELSLGGLGLFGKPMLYAVFAALLAQPPEGEGTR